MNISFHGRFTLRTKGRRTRSPRNHVTHAGMENYSRLLADDPAYGVDASGPTFGAPLYVGLIGEEDYTAEARADSMGSHPGWVEAVGYLELARPAIVLLSEVSSPLPLLTSAQMTFTPTEDFSVRGLFVTDSDGKGGSSGNLWSTATMDNPLELVVGQLLLVTYRLQASTFIVET